MRRYIILLILFLLMVFGVNFFLFPPNIVNEYTHFTIKKGMTTKEIAKGLKKLSVIKSERKFVAWAKIKGAGSHLQAGTYRFKKFISIDSVLNQLIKGKTVLIKITIPEGFNADQISERLSKKWLGDYKIFKSIIKKEKLEGYLYPETYFFDPGYNERDILDIMVTQFHSEIDPVFQNYDFSKKDSLNKKDMIVLASLIEREAKVEEERARISAVFHNRLRKRWYLESCATVQYILGKPKKKLRYKDLKIKSPYNTYIRLGLPPGPICSPGKKSILAALYPSKENIMFFVRDKDDNIGGHVFSKRYKHHIAAKKKKHPGLAMNGEF